MLLAFASVSRFVTPGATYFAFRGDTESVYSISTFSLSTSESHDLTLGVTGQTPHDQRNWGVYKGADGIATLLAGKMRNQVE